jgi:hypothetical protein
VSTPFKAEDLHEGIPLAPASARIPNWDVRFEDRNIKIQFEPGCPLAMVEHINEVMSTTSYEGVVMDESLVGEINSRLHKILTGLVEAGNLRRGHSNWRFSLP